MTNFCVNTQKQVSDRADDVRHEGYGSRTPKMKMNASVPPE
jgi:hypothetical protein